MALTIEGLVLTRLPAQWVNAFEDTPIVRKWTRHQPLNSSLLRAARHVLPRTLVREGVAFDHTIREGRFQRGLALIAGASALLGGVEVSYEHVQGSYSQRVMYSPVMISGMVAVAGVWGAFNSRIARTLLPISSAVLLADGVVGFLYHVRGIHRKPGGWRLAVTNIVMGPPLFAPLLLGISGMLGLIASALRRADAPRTSGILGLPRRRAAWRDLVPRGISHEGITLEQHVREGRFQKVLAIATAVSGLLNGAEALYSHYKNNFRYRVQWVPIALSPVLAIAGFGAVGSKRIAHTLLPLASLAAVINGGLGFYFHARGILRRPGALKTPVYNVLYGPPIFAPLLYAATGFLGLLSSLLRRAD